MKAANVMRLSDDKIPVLDRLKSVIEARDADYQSHISGLKPEIVIISRALADDLVEALGGKSDKFSR